MPWIVESFGLFPEFQRIDIDSFFPTVFCYFQREDFQRSLLYHYRDPLLFFKRISNAADIKCSLFLLLDTVEIASVNLPIPVQTRNYYKNVSDNKEIVKLVSVLSTIISSTKKVCHGDVQPAPFPLQPVPVCN